jgi:hypothetical protein
MKSKIVALFVVGSAIGGVAGINSGCYGTPASTCFAAHGIHFVRYYPTGSTPTTGPCSPDPTTGQASLYGETVGMEDYLGLPIGPGPDGGDGTFNGIEYFHPDYTHLTMALQSNTLANLASSGLDTTDSPISMSPYSAFPNDGGICFATAFTPAEQNIPSQPTDAGPTAAIDIVYQWSNFQMVSTTAVQGTQWMATLTYTDKVNACTGTYTAVGINPVVACARCLCSDGTDCNPDGTCNGTATPGTVPDNRICNPNNNLDAGFLASGIDPFFPVYCDPNVFVCLLVPQTAGQAPAIPDTNPGWFNNAPWLTDAGG